MVDHIRTPHRHHTSGVGSSPAAMVQWVAIAVGSLLASLMIFGVLGASAASAQGSPPADTFGPQITRFSLVDGSTLSLAGTPKLFPRGRQAVFLRGRVDGGADQVYVRIEDFWSINEWHPSRRCPRPLRFACKDGSMERGKRWAAAGLGRASRGTRPFTFRAELPDGFYRISVLGRKGNGPDGVIQRRWFKVNRGATKFATGPQVLVTKPEVDGLSAVPNGRGNVPFRVVATASTTQLDWTLRFDDTGRFYNQETGQFDVRTNTYRRRFDGWQLVDLGRTYFNWDAPLPPGDYTMWTTGINSRDKAGKTIRIPFTVARQRVGSLPADREPVRPTAPEPTAR